jgi:hypothetical protein
VLLTRLFGSTGGSLMPHVHGADPVRTTELPGQRRDCAAHALQAYGPARTPAKTKPPTSTGPTYRRHTPNITSNSVDVTAPLTATATATPANARELSRTTVTVCDLIIRRAPRPPRLPSCPCPTFPRRRSVFSKLNSADTIQKIRPPITTHGLGSATSIPRT